MKKIILISYLLITTITITAQQTEFPKLTGPYLGQKLPGMTPEAFTPDIFSKEREQHDLFFGPGGLEAVWTERNPADNTFRFLYTRSIDGIWSDPIVIPFSTTYRNMELCMSMDGSRLYFASDRPTSPGGEAQKMTDIWMSEKTVSGWGEPQCLTSSVNSPDLELQPYVGFDGRLYFIRQSGKIRRIMCLMPGEGASADSVSFGVDLFEKQFAGFCISPDEQIMILHSRMEGGFGSWDLYASFRDSSGNWGDPVNLGEAFNTEGVEGTVSFSPDGKYLFFARDRKIWWIDAKAIVQGTERKSLSLDRTVKGRIIDWVGSKVTEIYVYPDTAKAMAEFIRRQYQNNQYDTVTTLRTFAELLTRDLRSIYPDKHLAVLFDPSVATADNNPVSEAERMERQKEQWRMHNYGFTKLEQLFGNVGYLKLDGFANSSWARDEAVGVMRFFSNCDALIIDLRDNRGGHGNMVKLILSYFFKEATQLSSRYIRKENRIEQTWTTDEVDGLKLSDVDLYVLTSNRTFSAAEAFASNLKGLNRATIVGEKTAGGGHTVESVSSPDFKITARIPDSRGLDKSFEGEGVEPNVTIASENAFDLAYILALENLSKKAEGNKKSILAWTAEYQRTLLQPYKVQSKTLKKLAGSYRSLKIQCESDCLYVIWPDAKDRKLLFAISEYTFVVKGESDVRLSFKIDESGQATAVKLIYSDGYQNEIPGNKK